MRSRCDRWHLPESRNATISVTLLSNRLTADRAVHLRRLSQPSNKEGGAEGILPEVTILRGGRRSCIFDGPSKYQCLGRIYLRIFVPRTRQLISTTMVLYERTDWRSALAQLRSSLSRFRNPFTEFDVVCFNKSYILCHFCISCCSICLFISAACAIALNRVISIVAISLNSVSFII